MKQIAWSYSSLNDFANCPRAYQLKRVTKEIPFTETKEMAYGNKVHKHLEDRVNKKTPLPDDLEWLEAVIAKFEATGGEVVAEREIALDKGLKPVSWFDKTTWMRAKLDLTIRRPEVSVICDYKGLALDTPIPTPSGWSTMGELKVGDTVFGGDGKPCRVTAKSEVHHRVCHELVFDDKVRVVCDDEHLWVTNGEVRTASDIAKTLRHPSSNQCQHRIELHKGLHLPDADLPIHPYVLGVWLGDGKHTSGEVCKPDAQLWENIQKCGYEISHDYSERAQDGKATTRTIIGLRTELRLAGLLGNKHVPEIYLRASHEQRLQLLQGLMDTDGSGNATRQQAVFMTCDKRLSDSVMELLYSLGQRPNQCETTQRGFGLTVKAWPVHFKPLGIQAFTLDRKQARIADAGIGKSWRRIVMSADVVDTVPTQCISVDSPDETYLCGKAMVVTHNTGKRKDDVDQLMLFAAVEFTIRPEAEKVKSGYIWTKHKAIDSQTYVRGDLPKIWGHFMPKVEKVMKAHEKDEWPAKPSGLCGWCPASKAQCKYVK